MRTLLFVLLLLPTFATAGLAPIEVPSGTTYKYIPSGMQAAGAVITGSTGIASVLAPGASGNVVTSNGSAWVSSAAAAPTLAVSTKTTTYTLTNSDDVILCNGSFTITTQSAASATKKMYYVKNIGTGTCTISAADNIDGAGTLVISTQYAGVQIFPDGSTWWGF